MSIQFYCERCGGLFNAPRASRRFCDTCGVMNQRETQREYWIKRRAKVAAQDGTIDRLKRAIQKHLDAVKKLDDRINKIKAMAEASV